MGFVEHFSGLDSIIERHLEFLKPGGMLIIGVPSFLGINHWLMRRLAPRRLSQHNLLVMEISSLASFERKFGLEKLFKGYIGGFKPTAYAPRESFTFWHRIINKAARLLEATFWYRLPILNRFNARCISCYAIGIWKKRPE